LAKQELLPEVLVLEFLLRVHYFKGKSSLLGMKTEANSKGKISLDNISAWSKIQSIVAQPELINLSN
jgi:hypothetical protein